MAAEVAEHGAIAFAEKVLQLLDEGRYTATYKYAVLLALMDLVLEHTTRSGSPPDVLMTRQLAEKIVEIYWPQTRPFAHGRQATVLAQNLRGQAEILVAIAAFRKRCGLDPTAPLWEARHADPDGFERLVRGRDIRTTGSTTSCASMRDAIATSAHSSPRPTTSPDGCRGCSSNPRTPCSPRKPRGPSGGCASEGGCSASRAPSTLVFPPTRSCGYAAVTSSTRTATHLRRSSASID